MKTAIIRIDEATIPVTQKEVIVTTGGGQGPRGPTGLPGGNVESIGLFADAMGMTLPTPKPDYLMTSGWDTPGIGRAGYFQDAAVDMAYVAQFPSSSFIDVDGDGWRIDPKQQLHIEMFGGKCDTAVAQFAYTAPAFTATRAITPGTDNLAPLLEAIKIGGGYIHAPYRKGQPIYALGGNEGNAYYFSDTIDPPHATHLIGNTSSHYLMGGTVFLFPANKGGIKLLPYGYGGRTLSSHGSTIEGIYFFGSGGSTRTAHGLLLRAFATVRDCCFEGFAGDGINNVASASISTSDPDFGQTSGSFLQRIMLRQCGNWGMVTKGSDSSASLFIGIQVQTTRLGGIYEDPYFNNTYIAPEIDDHGTGYKGQVHRTGRLYSLISPLAGAGAANDPATSPTIWYDRGAGGISAAFPDWSGAGSYEMSSPIGGDPASYCTTTFISPYVEGNDPIALGPGALIINGNSSPTRNTGRLAKGSQSRAVGGPTGVGGYTPYSPAHATLGAYFKSEICAADGEILAHGHAIDGAFWKWEHTGPDSVYGYGGIGTGNPSIWKITGPNSVEQFGSGANQPHWAAFYGIALGTRTATVDAVRVMAGSAAPTTGSWRRGDTVRNNGFTGAGSTIEWVCKTAGTPGTWYAVVAP